MSARLSSFVLAFGLASGACGSPATSAGGSVLTAAPDDRLSDLIAAALEADTRLAVPDSLYASDATVHADGRPRVAPPRFAAVGVGGSVAVTSTKVEVRSGVAWAFVEYRYLSSGGDSVREGVATIILVTEGGAWRIRHAHSSTPAGGPDQVSFRIGYP